MMKNTFGLLVFAISAFVIGCSSPNAENTGMDITLESISITTNPVLKIYATGIVNSVNDINLDGLAVTGTYSNGVTKPETITPNNLSTSDSLVTLGTKTITITVSGKTDTFTISIREGLSATIITNAASIANYIWDNCSGGTSASPKSLAIIGELTAEKLITIITTVNSAGTYVNLDLSGADLYLRDLGSLLKKSSTVVGKDKIKGLVLPETLTAIGELNYYDEGGIFGDCQGLSSVTLPHGLAIIGNRSFMSCINLENINFPSGITAIGDQAFIGCTNLTEISLPQTITTIGGQAFMQCTNIASVILPGCENLNSIGEGVFSGCPNLSFTASGTVWTTAINGKALIKNGNTLVAYPSAVDIVDLSSLPNITYIGQSAFGGLGNLTGIIFPANLISIGDSAFDSCNYLTNFILPETLTSIGLRAFDSCYGITSVTIPATVNSIGNSAFTNCVNIITFTVHASIPPVLGTNVFWASGSESQSLWNLAIKVPPSSVFSYKTADNWINYADKIVGLSE